MMNIRILRAATQLSAILVVGITLSVLGADGEPAAPAAPAALVIELPSDVGVSIETRDSDGQLIESASGRWYSPRDVEASITIPANAMVAVVVKWRGYIWRPSQRPVVDGVLRQLADSDAADQVSRLRVYTQNCSDAGLRTIRRLTGLESLTVHWRAEELWIEQPPAAGDDMDAFPGRFALIPPEITDLGFDFLESLVALRELEIAGLEHLSDATLSRAFLVPTLHSIKIVDAPYVLGEIDEMQGPEGQLAELEELVLEECSVTSLGIRRMLERVRGLRRLTVTNECDAAELADVIARQDRLQLLRVAFNNVDDAWVETVSAGCVDLRHLSLDRSAITDSAIASLATLPLETLSLSGCQGITDEGVLALASVNTLTRLWLSATNISQDAIREFRTALPDCRVVGGRED